MTLENDLDALGAITAAENNQPSDKESDAVVQEALEKTDMESIDSVLVDFSQVQAEQERAESLSFAAEKLRVDGKIDQLTAQGLSSISKTILGQSGQKVAYTQVATRVGLATAIESLLAEHEATISQTKHACSELIIRAGKTGRNQLFQAQAESKKVILEFANTLADFNDEYYSVNLREVVLNNGELSMEKVLNDRVSLTDPLFGEQSLFHGCKPLLTKLLLGKDTACVACWINMDKHYVVVDSNIVDVEQAVEERSFKNKSVFYPEDKEDPCLQAIIQAAGSKEQADYEAILAAGITEAAYLLQAYLDKPADNIANPQQEVAEVIYLTKAISSMLRAFSASILITQIATEIYKSLLNNSAAPKSE